MVLTTSPPRRLFRFCFTIMIIYSLVVPVQGQSFDLSYHIREELPLYSTVGNVGRDSNISYLLSVEDYTTLRYRILMNTGTDTQYFTIVNTTGVLQTARVIDREERCQYDIVCKMVIRVAAQTESGHQFYTFKITVYIDDINDNSPSFPMSKVNINIDEDAAIDKLIPIDPATDRDILNNTIQRYSLVGSEDTFGLQVTRNLDDSLTPQLFVKSPLDRERRPFYELEVRAWDGGSPRKSGKLTINVTLNDVNDNAPIFSRQTYDVSVPEVAAPESTVLTLSATDADIGNNGRVTYRLGARLTEEAFQSFRINGKTGDILTNRDLTSFQGQTMRLVVEAVDHGAKAHTAQAVVNIHIEDSQNNAPVIHMTIPPGSPISRITENASPGVVVAHFMVEDTDTGENGRVWCHLQDDVFGLQRLKEAEYKVTVYSKLDREIEPLHEVIITCLDGGNPQKTTNVEFTVILEDANDNPPRFDKSEYRANITENSDNTYILKLEAEDIDLGMNGSVTYGLGNVTSLVRSYIRVNPITGEVSTKQKLDRELCDQLDFQVIAADAGSPSLSSTARVIIDVLDVNDNIPSVPAGYYMTIMENRAKGSIVGQIEAIDPDAGPAGQVGYQLLTDNEATRLFNLTQSGVVRALETFDRESRDIYDINVLARDYGNNPKTNILHIRIFVTDDNDHPPVFRFPRGNNRTVHTNLDARYNSTITKVSATDADKGNNATLTYTIIDGGKDVFEVEPRTGRIYTLRTMYTKDKGKYTITLFVRDNGAPPLSNTGSLVIVVSQGNGTAAYTGFGNNEHILIVAILVGATVVIAVVVFLIVLRFLKKDRRDRRPKYTGGLPMEVKTRTQTQEDDVSSDEGPWRRYDAAKRPNGPAVSGDVVYEPNDDIIMFKLKLADQYKELEPEDKELGCGASARDDASSNRNSFHSDVDGAPEVSRDRTVTRLATFQGKSAMPPPTGFGSNADHKEKVWRTALKEKMTDEILSSSSRETTGADSGRGPSEDGSQSRSSVTDDSGCLISPSHSILRGNTPKHQGTYSRPPSGSGYDRPPLLMTFQSTSPDHVTNGNGSGGGGFCTYGNRKDYGPPPYSSSPRHFNGYGRDYPQKSGGETLMIGDREITVHRDKSDLSPLQDMKQTTLKKFLNGEDTIGGSKGSLNGPHKSNGRINGLVKGGERGMYPTGKGREVRLCSEPPIPMDGDKVLVAPYNKRGVQETGLSPGPSPSPTHLSPNAMHTNTNKPRFVGGDKTRSQGNKGKFVYPPSPNYLQSSSPTSPNNFKQISCPQLYKDPSMSDPHSQSTLPATNRSRSFNNHDLTFTVPSRSIHDMLNDSLETQDDGNTTTTSGSYTIDHDELALDLPQTDVFV